MKKYSFPDKFLWGSAFSGSQTEGAFAIDGKAPTKPSETTDLKLKKIVFLKGWMSRMTFIINNLKTSKLPKT